MSYDELDAAIVARITAGATSLGKIDSGDVRRMCADIARATGRESFRVLDGRLQALRKKGVIAMERASINGAGGWRVAGVAK